MGRKHRIHLQESQIKTLPDQKYEKSGPTQNELVDAYKKEIRSILELAVPVWHSGLTTEHINRIERVQKASLVAILGTKYTSYESALAITKLEKLSARREIKCLRFITKNLKSERPFFQKSQKSYKTRSSENFVNEFYCRTQKFYDSSLPFLARLYNENLTN